MPFLLLPPDEAVLVEDLTTEFGLSLLASDLTSDGEPRVITSPAEVLSADLALPAQPHQESTAPEGFLWWCPQLGPIRRLRDAPSSEDPRDHVAALLTREASDAWPDLIDFERTPVVRYWRARWHDEGRTRVQPGVLQAKAPEARRLHGRILRWMKERGERLDPFDHCRDVPIEKPSNLSPYWVWAWPHALSWIRSGGEVWPWTA